MPDIFDLANQQMQDVKTTGKIPDQYAARQSAVDLKAATVPAEYRSAAREVDRKYNGTPAGTVGPVETLLHSMPQVVLLGRGLRGSQKGGWFVYRTTG